MKATLTRVLIVLGLLITSFATARQPQTAAAAADCQYVLGFATLHALIPQTVGDCAQNEYFNPANGDSLQQTTSGLLVWRKADNWTAFTDGYRTWVNGPNGVQERLNTERFCWEGDAGAKLTDGLCAAPTPVLSVCANPTPLDQTIAGLTEFERGELYRLPPLNIGSGGWTHWIFWISPLSGPSPSPGVFTVDPVLHAARQHLADLGLVIGTPGNIEGAPELAPKVPEALTWYSSCH